MKSTLRVDLGFAADASGNGVAYARAGSAGRVLRVAFPVKRFSGLQDREVGYAALQAVARALQQRGIVRANFVVEDPRLAGDLNEHRDVPPALTLAYVKLRCTLNQFEGYEIGEAPLETDLSQRARSEVALHVAA
ncbi:MAG TPA: hypothetical protein VFL13_03940 [Candidatus Baltobacteraceae bacterium]|nr:hypothetical protein [Candidatus Baltobacteraceae bacterium]